MGVEFRSMGHVAEVQSWKVTVNADGTVELEADSDYGPFDGSGARWRWQYSPEAWAELTELFTGAAALLSGAVPQSSSSWVVGQELSVMGLKALPVGAIVNDGDGSANPANDHWEKASNGWWVNQSEITPDRPSQELANYATRLTLVSLP